MLWREGLCLQKHGLPHTSGHAPESEREGAMLKLQILSELSISVPTGAFDPAIEGMVSNSVAKELCNGGQSAYMGCKAL